MTDTLTEPLPPLRHGEKYAQLETDTFCVGCGYNLHAQPVVRDERLGIFICRCPECGRFHPAGTGVTAITPWLARLASGLLAFWVLIVLGVLTLACIGFGAVQYLTIEMTTYRKMLTMTGEEVEWATLPNLGTRWVKKGTTQPANAMRMVYSLDPPSSNSPWHYMRQWWEPYAAGGIGFAMGLAGGLLLVVFIWHWPRHRYAWTLLLPAAVATFMAVMFAYDESFEQIWRWSVQTCFAIAAVEAMGILVGIKIGRPVARLLLRMFVPAKPRQHFNFLWRVDGKTPAPLPKPE